MTKNAKGGQRSMFLRLLDEAYDKTTWHGPNLRSSVRGVTALEAVWRPDRERRNIVEIVVHCAYTKNLVRRRLVGTKRRDFPLKGSNWFEIPKKLTRSRWRDYLSILQHEHGKLRAALQAASLPLLATWRAKDIIVGVTFHDIYHAGQIRTLRALRRSCDLGRRNDQ